MTSPAKIAANRRNAIHSIGPHTPTGKLIVTRNAVRHGIFARLPVVPGESEADWQTHRQGITDSLDPVGLLEVTLAERVVLLLWRLTRLARYEAANTVAAMEDSGLLPPEADPIAFAGRHHNHHNQLLMAEQDVRRQREAFFTARADADLLRRTLSEGAEAEPLPAKSARSLLGEAYTLAMDCPMRHYEPLWHTDKAFLSRIGLPTDRPAGAAWPRDTFLTAVDYYAGATEWPAAEFRVELLRTLDSRAAGFARGVKRREAEVSALNRRLDAEADRSAATALLPPEVAAERIMKYEKHLYTQLTSTLHELERLQARRGGSNIPPPQVADLLITVEHE